MAVPDVGGIKPITVKYPHGSFYLKWYYTITANWYSNFTAIWLIFKNKAWQSSYYHNPFTWESSLNFEAGASPQWLCGRSLPVSIDMVVVLPAPLCPSNTVICPSYMLTRIPATATLRFPPLPNTCKENIKIYVYNIYTKYIKYIWMLFSPS